MVLAGSTIAANAADSMPAKAAEVRKSCEDDGIIVNGVFTKDFEFNSWSLAAGVVLGCSASGPKEWRSDNN